VLTAEEKGKYAIAYHSDMSKYGPKAQLTAVMHLYDKFYTKTAQALLDHTWKPEAVWTGIREGSIKLAPINPVVPGEVAALVEKKKQGIVDGSFHPFQGPIRDQAGKEVVAAGHHLSDKELLGMNYYVEGVLGSVPK
jgi:simple sugar transport system substrate-binding protein